MEEWNTLWELFLKENGFVTPCAFVFINIIDPDEQWIVSDLKENEGMTSCHYVIQSVTNSVSKITLPSSVMNYETSHGIVDS